ncbi:MAG: glycosyltransferase family 4 protein [Ignavibacteriaceae bacterium]|nr:glycosyltransferase family 4 protein [Ignavibacteriaceae bacterium]
MRIGIDARLLSGNMTGISRYLWNVIKYIPEFDKKNKYFLYLQDEVVLKNSFYNYVNVPKSKLPKQVYSHYWLNFVLPKSLEKNKIDLFFTPYILVPVKKSLRKNVIVIHDVMTRACPQFFTAYYKKYMSVIVPQSIKRADAIVTVSQSAKNDIVKFYGVLPDKITVTHLWTDDNYRPLDIDREERIVLMKKYDLPEKFILYVGAIEERKNIPGILKISDILKSNNIDIKIVLIGAKGFGFDRFKDEIIKRKDRVLHIDYVPEQDLPFIYNLAKIFLFPSFYEGFGLPPLEAMKCGLPVLAGKNSSVIEVVGEGGLLYDVEAYKSFADSIISLLNDEHKYFNMKHRAIKQSENFKPENEIVKLINLFNTLK